MPQVKYIGVEIFLEWYLGYVSHYQCRVDYDEDLNIVKTKVVFGKMFRLEQSFMKVNISTMHMGVCDMSFQIGIPLS